MSYDKRFIILCLPSCCYYLENENSMLQWSNRQQTIFTKEKRKFHTLTSEMFHSFAVEHFIENGPVFMGWLLYNINMCMR